MTTVKIDGGKLVVKPAGLDQVWALRRSIEVPLAHVRGATIDPGAAREPQTWRGPGLRVPGARVGTFHRDGEQTFFDVHSGEHTIVIELSDEEFVRLIVEVEDPRGVVDQINGAVAAA